MFSEISIYQVKPSEVDTFEAISTGGAKKAAETQYHIEDQELSINETNPIH